jgi:predicted TIM-barrel fold metal-dependent hydrolase
MTITRREALTRTLAGGCLLSSRSLFAKAAQPATKVNFAVPANACDSHTHIFGDLARFPMWSGRSFTPETALPSEMARMHRALHIARVVIVTPSIYRTDNSATLDAIKERGATARGIAVIDETTPERDLDMMNAGGIRGIRLNLVTTGQVTLEGVRKRFQAAAVRIRRLGWHVQIYSTLELAAGLKDLVADSPVPVVFDHFASAQAAKGVDQPGFGDIVALVKSGKAYVKISGAYRIATPPDYADAAPLAKALIAANADRVLWGTDWPHPNAVVPPGGKTTDVLPLMQVDDGKLLNLLPAWAPDAALRKKILVDNPARLYGF